MIAATAHMDSGDKVLAIVLTHEDLGGMALTGIPLVIDKESMATKLEGGRFDVIVITTVPDAAAAPAQLKEMFPNIPLLDMPQPGGSLQWTNPNPRKPGP